MPNNIPSPEEILGAPKKIPTPSEILGTSKKKVVSESPSEQPKVSSSSATQKTVEQKPSVSSGSEDNIFSGYPGKEDKQYKLINGTWNEVVNPDPNSKAWKWSPIKDAKRVESLNKVFKQDASTTERQKTFVGYPNQQGAEYRIVDGKWEKKSYGKEDFTPIVNENSVKSLNAFFKQDAKMADISDTQAAVIIKSINKDLLNSDEEELVPKLQKMFKGTDNDIFNFEQTGVGYDAIKVTNKYTGESTEISIDNWTKNRDSEEAKLLKGFIDVNLQFKDQAINKKKIADLQKRQYEATPTDKILIQQQIDELQKDVDADETLKKNYALSQGKHTAQAIYNKEDVKAISNTITAKKSSAVVLKEDKKQLDLDKKKADDDLIAGKITQQEYDFKYKEDFDNRGQEIYDRAQKIQSDLKDLSKKSVDLDKIAGLYIQSQEDRGNVLSGTASSFLKGVTTGIVGTPLFLMEVDKMITNPDEKMDFKKIADEIAEISEVGSTSKEYLTSGNRGMVEQAIYGITESVGQTVGGYGTSGVLSMMGASYVNFRSEIDSNPEFKDVPTGEKILLASALTAPIAILDKIGLDEVLTKNPYSNKAINWVLQKTFSSLPKNASKEVLENAIKSNVKAAISKGLLTATEKGIIEGTTEALETNVEMGTKAIYNWAKEGEFFNTPKNAAEWWKQTSDSFIVGAIGGAALNTATQAYNIPVDKMNMNDLNVAASSIMDENMKDMIHTSLNSKVVSGEIKQSKAKEIMDNMSNLESIITKVPEDISDEGKLNAVKLIDEKSKLEKQITGKDKALVTAQTDRINAINEELKAISINNSKTEQDATKESTEQQQEVPTESSTVEYQGADQGQQEVGQGEGSERTTTQPEANISDSTIASEEAQVIPSVETKIEEYEQRTENEVVAPNIETTKTKKAKSIPRTRKALEVETNDLQDLVKKHFISGGKINVSSAMQSLFGNKGDKSIASEYRKRIGLHSKGGQTIDGLAHLLWEQNKDTLGESVTTMEWRDAVESVLTNEIGTKNMIDSLLTKSEESVTDEEAKYWENKYDMNAIQDFDESELMDAESVLDNMTDEEMAQMYDEIVASEQAEYNPTIEEISQIKDKKLYTEKAYSFFDELSKQLDKFGKENTSMGIAPAILKPIIETIKLGLKAGMTIEQAIRDASAKHTVKEQDINDAIYSMSEAQKAKTRERVTGEKQGPTTQKTEASTAAKNISKKTKTKVTVDEYTALKDQLRLEARAARESKKDIKTRQAELIAKIKEMSVRGKMDTKAVGLILDKINKLNLDNQVKVDEFIDYVRNKFKVVDYDNKLKTAKNLRKSISKNLTNRANPFAKLAKEFTKLKVTWVEDIDAYNDIAQKIYDSVRRTKFTKEDMNPKDEADIEEVFNYVSKEQESQSLRAEENFKNRYEEITGLSADDKTILEMRKELAQNKVDYTEERKQKVKEAIDDYAAMVEDTDPQVVKDAVNVDLSILDLNDAVEIMDALNTYFANGTIAKMSSIMAKYKGKFNNANSKLKSKDLRLFGSKKLGSIQNDFLTNLNIIAERMFSGIDRGRQFLKETGFTDVYNGANKAEKLATDKSNEYVKRFNKKGFDSIENVYERSVLAWLDRHPEVGEDIDTFFDTRKKLLKQSYETLSKGTSDEKVMAEAYKKTFDKLDLDNAKNINDIKSKTSQDNIDAVQFIQDMWADNYDDLSDFALRTHNIMLAKDNNYTTDVFKKTQEQVKKDRNSLDPDLKDFAFGNFSNLSLDKKEAGVLMESSRPKSLTKGRYVSLDFDNNMFNAYRLALTDMYTAEGIRQFDAYFNGDNIENIIENSEDRSIIREAMNGYVNSRKGKDFSDKMLIDHFKKIVNYTGSLGAFRALGSLRQFPIQYVSAISNTLINGGFSADGKWFLDLTVPFDKKINALIDRSGRSIANRGADSLISAMDKETDVMKKIDTSGKVLKAAEYPIGKLTDANKFILKKVLVSADIAGARTMWWAFYQKRMHELGLEIDLDGEINNEAADYAQSMTDRQAEVSDTALRGKVFKSKNGATAFIRDVLMPFAGFSMNQKNRLYSDANLFFGKHTDKENRLTALRSLTGTVAELTATTMVRYYIGKLIIWSAVSILGLDDEDDEVKKMYEKLDGNVNENMLSRAIQDIISPNPILDKQVLKGINKMISSDKLNEEDAKKFQEEIDAINQKRYLKGDPELTKEEIADKKEDFILKNQFQFYVTDEADYGMMNIEWDKISETMAITNAYKTGKVEKTVNGKIEEYYLIDSDRKRLLSPMLLKYGANILPAESDMISNKSFKLIKDRALSESKFEKYNEVKKEVKITPFAEKLIRETSSKTESIIREVQYAEEDEPLTQGQIKEYMKVRFVYGSKAIGLIPDIKEGRTAKQILGK